MQERKERNLGRILNRGEGLGESRNGEFGLAWEHQKFIHSSSRESENMESRGVRQIDMVVGLCTNSLLRVSILSVIQGGR